MKHMLPILLLLALSSCTLEAQEVNWLTLEKAQQLQNSAPKPIFVDVYTPWCGPCKRLTLTTFKDPAVVDYLNEHFYAVKFNAESPETVNFGGKQFGNPQYIPGRDPMRGNAMHSLAREWGVTGYPSLLLLDSKLKTLQKITGFRSATQLMEMLKGTTGAS